MSVRIALGPWALKRSAKSWAVGKLIPRKIHGADTEEMLAPSYHGDLDTAWWWFALPVLARPGQVVRDWRESVGMTPRELADWSNVSVRTIGRIEREEVSPKWATVAALFGALHAFGGLHGM